MNKEEILAKAQKQNKKLDEREQSINQKAATFSLIVCILVSFGLIAFNLAYDQPYQDIFGLYSATLSVYWGYKGWKQKELLYLLDALLFFGAAIFLIAGYVSHIAG